MNCFKENILLPFKSELYSEQATNNKTVSDMMNFLKKNNYHIHADATPHEVQEIYENSLISTSNHEELLPKIMYPLLSNSTFRNDVCYIETRSDLHWLPREVR